MCPLCEEIPEEIIKKITVGPRFPGTFEIYAASLISHWQATDDSRINDLENALELLGLTWKVRSKKVDDVSVEVMVGRLPHKSQGIPEDLVSIDDVGFGISQTLPVIIALLAAEPGQLVYIEQPEIHLHPRAQTAMAQILADAANRGVNKSGAFGDWPEDFSSAEMDADIRYIHAAEARLEPD